MVAAHQSSNAKTSFEFLVLGFEFKHLPNREIHEIREKEMRKIIIASSLAEEHDCENKIMATTAAGIEIAPETIGHLLKEKDLQVPLSQRSYRWEHDHISELYEDINAAIHDNLDEYFIGSVVGIKSKGITYIYDGQQRLATTMILVAAIRDYFCEIKDVETARLIEDESLLSKARKTHEETPHFRLNAEDHEFFYSRILLRPAIRIE